MVEERKMKTALMTAKHLQDFYPNNVITSIGSRSDVSTTIQEEKSFQRVLLLSLKIKEFILFGSFVYENATESKGRRTH